MKYQTLLVVEPHWATLPKKWDAVGNHQWLHLWWSGTWATGARHHGATLRQGIGRCAGFNVWRFWRNRGSKEAFLFTNPQDATSCPLNFHVSYHAEWIYTCIHIYIYIIVHILYHIYIILYYIIYTVSDDKYIYIYEYMYIYICTCIYIYRYCIYIFTGIFEYPVSVVRSEGFHGMSKNIVMRFETQKNAKKWQSISKHLQNFQSISKNPEKSRKKNQSLSSK